MAIFSNSIIPAAAADDDVVTKSLRFDDGSSPSLTFAPSLAGDQDVWTLSFWTKRTSLGQFYPFTWSDGTSGGNYAFLGFTSSDTLEFYSSGTTYRVTDAKFRDTAAFYHIVLRVDTGESTDADRMRIYVNGEQQSTSTTASISSSIPYVNGTETCRWGAFVTALYYDGYIADAIFIDGTSYAPTSFAIGDDATGQWKPKDTSGLTYGNNGFHLEMKQTGTGTGSSSTIGADTSGEDNHFDTGGLAASDVVGDTPTNNFCTWSPIGGPPRPAMTFSEGNLKTVGNYNTHFARIMGTMLVSSGKWFHEIRCGTTQTNSREYGFKGHQTSWPLSGGSHGLGGGSAEWDTNAEFAFSAYWGGVKFSNSSSPETSGTTWGTAGDIIGLALDLDSSPRTFRVFKNGSEVGTATDIPTGGSDDWVPAMDPTSEYSQTSVANFGQDATFAGAESGTTYTTDASDDDTGGEFTMQPPAGYKAWTTKNLTATIAKPEEHFNTVLYAGNSPSDNDITTVGFQADLTWIKSRSNASNHSLCDSVREATKELYTNTTGVEYTDTDGLKSWDGDGFTVGQDGDTNNSGWTFVAWNWLAGTSFDAGGGSGTGSKNPTAGFSIATWTGDDDGMGFGASPQAITHGLNPLTPEMIIAKNRTANSSTSGDWAVWHKDLSSGKYLTLNNNADEESWGDALFSSIGSTTVSVSNDPLESGIYLNYADNTGESLPDDTYVGYFFASVAGYSKVGKWVGTGVSGNLIYTGFRPRFLIYKHLASGHNWHMIDDKRDTYNAMDEILFPDLSNAVSTGEDFDFLSNGFRIHDTTGPYNQSGEDYIFYAVGQSSKHSSAS